MKSTTNVTSWTCDRCGTKRASHGEALPNSWGQCHHHYTIRDFLGNGAGGIEEHDLCDECSKALREFLKPIADKEAEE